jgi:ABC-type bacteriocin/lantibiotic exporter with double-glycine peptidase domain
MSDLQTAFYIIGIIYMSIMFLIMVTLLIVALMIRAKINHMQRMINKRINAVRDTAGHLIAIIQAARSVLRGTR